MTTSCCPGVKSCGKCLRGILCDPCNRLLTAEWCATHPNDAYLFRYRLRREPTLPRALAEEAVRRRRLLKDLEHKQKEDPMTEPQATQVDPVRETLVKDLEYVSRKSTIREAMGGAMMPREVYDYPVEMRTQHRTSSLRTITPTPAPRRPSGEPTMKASCKSCGRRSRTCAKQARPTRTSWPSWPARSTSNDQLRRVRDRV